MADQRQAQVGEWGQITRRPDAAAARDHGDEVPLVELQQPAEGRHRDAGVAQPEGVDLQPQHHPGDLGRHRVADPDRVAEQQVPLEPGELVVRHPLPGEGAEPGVDAVVGVAVGQRGLDPRPRPLHGRHIRAEVGDAGGEVGVQVRDGDAGRRHCGY